MNNDLNLKKMDNKPLENVIIKNIADDSLWLDARHYKINLEFSKRLLGWINKRLYLTFCGIYYRAASVDANTTWKNFLIFLRIVADYMFKKFYNPTELNIVL